MSKEYIKQVYDLTMKKLKVTATIYEEYHEIEKVPPGNEVFILSGKCMKHGRTKDWSIIAKSGLDNYM